VFEAVTMRDFDEIYRFVYFNPFRDEQLNLLGIVPRQFAILVHFIYLV